MATRSIRIHTLDTSTPTFSERGHDQGSRSHPRQRREKPQLSCNLCRRRKVRCDRQNPCGTCSRRGFARSCIYSAGAQEDILPRSAGTVHERLHQLESLVINLMRQDRGAPATLATTSLSDPPNDASQRSLSSGTNEPGYLGPWPQSPVVAAFRNATQNEHFSSGNDIEANESVSSLPLDCGSMKLNSLSTGNYVGSAHWAAVLDSIAELKDHFAQEEEACKIATDVDSSWPQLLYGCPRATKDQILSSIPPRQVVDRLVSRYFTLDIATAVLHSGQFLREYDHFWEDPCAAPIMWVGLLFTIMCLGAEPSKHYIAPMRNIAAMPMLASDPFILFNLFRERIVQCLVLGKYTKGGPYVLETLIQYFMIEHFLRPDAEFEIWIMLGMLVPIALRMGLHRDPKHFSGISAFAGEMQRRVWATIFQVDVGYSALAGLPRMIKPQQCDTEEPRNLWDSDFHEGTIQLPQSRPESDVTPVLFLLAKSRLISVGGIISDLAHDTRPYPYTELTRVEKLLQDTRNSLPPSLKWQPLRQSDTQDPQSIMQRMYLDMFFHQMLITLYKKYFLVSTTQLQYDHARETCLNSAINILKYQHLLDEETQLDSRFSSVRWRVSSILNHDFMLAASVLCFYIKLHNEYKESTIDLDATDNIRSILRKSHDIWLRSATASKEAQQAVQSLSIILGIEDVGDDDDGVADAFPDGSADFLAQFDNPDGWPACQDYLASFSLPLFELEIFSHEYPVVPLATSDLGHNSYT